MEDAAMWHATLAADVTSCHAVKATCRLPEMPHVCFQRRHMSSSGRATCRVPVAPCVYFRSSHVFYSGLATCPVLFAPRVVFWLRHMLYSGRATCCFLLAPRGSFWLLHVDTSCCDTHHTEAILKDVQNNRHQNIAQNNS